MPKTVYFMDVEFRLASREELLAAVDQASRTEPVRVATLNPEFMVEARRNADFRKALEGMTHCVVDGAGLAGTLRLWNRLARRGLSVERYPGADLAADLFSAYRKGKKSFYLLGGPPGLAARSSSAIRETYPDLQVAGAEDGGRIDPQAVRLDPALAARLAAAAPDILLVGFGAPKQELWIQEADAERLPVPVMVGVGGTFGFYVDKKRAPGWVRRAGLEWLYRTLSEAGHWKRLWRAVVLFPLYAFLWMGKEAAWAGKEEK